MLNAVVESRCGVTGFVRVHKVLMGLCLCYLSTDKAVDCGSMLTVFFLLSFIWKFEATKQICIGYINIADLRICLFKSTT